jgi:hypothetical protein
VTVVSLVLRFRAPHSAIELEELQTRNYLTPDSISTYHNLHLTTKSVRNHPVPDFQSIEGYGLPIKLKPLTTASALELVFVIGNYFHYSTIQQIL